MDTLRLDKKQRDNIFSKMAKAMPKWLDFIDISFLNDDFKKEYKEIITNRFEQITR
jgi:serine/threonine-protein kinase HipA